MPAPLSPPKRRNCQYGPGHLDTKQHGVYDRSMEETRRRNPCQGGSDPQDRIEVTAWAARGDGRYRFQGSIPRLGGFYADARLEYRGAWHVTIESTNYTGDPGRLAGLIGALAERM